jgi:hypothetical protein
VFHHGQEGVPEYALRFSFQTFLTSRVVKFLYVISTIVVALETIVFSRSSESDEARPGHPRSAGSAAVRPREVRSVGA